MGQKIEGKKIEEIRTTSRAHSVSGEMIGANLIALCTDESIHISLHRPFEHGNLKHGWKCISKAMPKNKKIIQWEFIQGGYGSRMWLLFVLCEDGSVWKRDREKSWVEIKNYP